MVRPKKQQKRGIDFKKIRRKIGKKLPPPNNATNTEIKSKAIILPEQSLASEKAGLALSKKGLTLKELLQQTSHHNAKVRKDALVGIRDLFLHYPVELRLHKSAAIEKLRERIGDDDKVVRETLYQLLNSIIFPGCKEDNQAPLLSMTMAYIFNAMTHLTIDVRLMAFKFFDLVVQYYPPSFSSNAEKILQNYEDILRKNHFYLEDKGKLTNTLSGLLRCLSLLPSDKTEANLCQAGIAEQGILHAYEPNGPKEPTGFGGTLKKLKDLIPVLVNCFQEFLPLVQNMPVLDTQSFDCMLSILKSIDLAVKFILYWTQKFYSEFQGSVSHIKKSDLVILDQTILPVLLGKLLNAFPLSKVHQASEKDDVRYFILNTVITEIYLQLREWICPSALFFDKFLEFIEKAFSGEISSGTRSHKIFCEKHVVSLLPFLPKLVSQVETNLKSRILQAFTKTFKDCRPESEMKLACLSTVEEMLIPGHGMSYLDANDPAILTHQITWIRELPLLLILLRDKHPSHSQIVLRLQLFLGKHALLNSSLEHEYNDLQNSLIDFYSTCANGIVCYGPFIRLPRESQELSICCLYYFSAMYSPLHEALASCCLCPDLEPSVLFRIIEVLHCAYKAGHIRIADHISFLITLLARFRVLPDNTFPVAESDSKLSNRGTFRSVSSVICSCLKLMGDDSVIFQMLNKLIVDQISQKPPLDNICALLRVLVGLDSRPSKLSEESIINLSINLAGYLIDIMCCIPEGNDESTVTVQVRERRYYCIPCFFLFEKQHTMLKHTLNMMGSLIAENISPTTHDSAHPAADSSSRISAVVSAILFMFKDVKVKRILDSCKPEINYVVDKINLLQASEEINMSIEERHRVHCAIDRLKIVQSTVHDGMLIT